MCIERRGGGGERERGRFVCVCVRKPCKEEQRGGFGSRLLERLKEHALTLGENLRIYVYAYICICICICLYLYVDIRIERERDGGGGRERERLRNIYVCEKERLPSAS